MFMDIKTAIKISVQGLLDFSLQSGDLGVGVMSPSRAVEGTKGHKAVRRSIMAQLPEGTSYEAEVPISCRFEGEHIAIEITGRIDGVLKASSSTTIHEIKTTTLPAGFIDRDYNPRHWAQAKIYAYVYSLQNSLDHIDILLTYYNLDDETEKSFLECCSFEELSSFFLPLAEDFLEWQELIHGWLLVRDESIRLTDFPYPAYRQGQQDLIAEIYDSIHSGNILFAQAPTGTGKTMAALYPAVKALGSGLVSKVFYLTAKTTTRSIAEKALEDMRRKGLRLKSVTITAKEKICPNGMFVCDAGLCEYASNYYGKVKKAILEAFREDFLDRVAIENCAAAHRVCPFELSLDLSLWCDVIICDYNYLFDPRVYLKRFFMQQRGDYCFLIDEAHNLVDRAREMYSAKLDKKTFQKLLPAVKAEVPGLYPYAQGLLRYFLHTEKELSAESEEDGRTMFKARHSPPEDMEGLLKKFTEYLENWLSRNSPAYSRDLLLDAYFKCLSFIRVLDLYDEKYVTYYDKSARNLTIRLFCVDPSALLKEAMERGRSSLLFSATLSPLEYFTRMLGGGNDASSLVLPSPFPAENLCVFLDDTISTRYRSRHLSYDRIAEEILTVATVKAGNYMVFFPSFEYLNEVYFRFMGIKTGIRTVCQTPGMSEPARQGFLDEFEFAGDTSLVGFAVMGGVFGEGIDLTGDRLSGAIIVGVGLPQVCNERNIIKRYFDELSGKGFEYAYVYPGINRVLQAAGRVIRTESDRGVIVLLDERFAGYEYLELLPGEWQPMPRAGDGCTLEEALGDFWEA